MVSLQGRKIAALVQSWSVIVKIVLCPLDSGSFTMKSIAIHSNSLERKGIGFCCDRVQRGSVWICVCLGHLTCGATLDVLSYVML